VNRDIIEQILQDYAALHRPDTDPELEAVRVAIMLEDVFGIVMSDVEIDPAVLADSSAVAAVVARHQGAV
jgi:hypothetical protein